MMHPKFSDFIDRLDALAMWAVLVIIFLVGFRVVAHGYDYTSDLHRDCLQAGLKDTSMFGVPLCEVVTVERLTKSDALRRKLQYRAVGWTSVIVSSGCVARKIGAGSRENTLWFSNGLYRPHLGVSHRPTDAVVFVTGGLNA
jgi:hypothetical protein